MELRKRAFLLVLFLSVLLSGCQASLSKFRPALEEEGEIFLYLQPLPQEADRLRFKIEGISVLGTDGREFPLSVTLHEVKGADGKRQRLLGFGRLPSASYGAFLLKGKEAFLKRENGEAALLVTDTPVKIEFPFDVKSKKAYVMTLVLRYPESIPGGFGFSPAFSISSPAKPITSLVGYVTNHGFNNITVFDKNSGEVVGVIATGRGPAGMALDQRQRRAYVALSEEDTIEVIDVTAGDVIDRLRLRTGDQPQELALTPDGRTLLAANTRSNTVSIIDPGSLLELSRIDVGRGPHSILIDATGRRAYVFNTLSSTITVIDIPNKTVITTVSTEPGPLRGQFNRNGDRLYVIHELSSYLTVIDPRSHSVVRRFLVRMGMSSVKVDTNTDLVYLGRKNDPVVEVYDPLSFVPVDFIQAGGGVTYMTIDGETNTLYLISPEQKTLMTTNLVGKKVTSVIDVLENPYWVTLMGER